VYLYHCVCFKGTGLPKIKGKKKKEVKSWVCLQLRFKKRRKKKKKREEKKEKKL